MSKRQSLLLHSDRSVYPTIDKRRKVSTAKVTILQAPPTKTAAKKAKGKPAEPYLSSLPATTRERVHQHGGYDQAAYVTTTNLVPRTLRRAKARDGAHVESFQRDYETAGSDLRSANMEASCGSDGLALPLHKIQAIDRLKGFEKLNPRAYGVCEAVLIYNARPSDIEAKGVNSTIASTMIQDAVEALAGFYTPSKKRPDKRLAAFARHVEEVRRREKA